jgi:predicted lipoprotein
MHRKEAKRGGSRILFVSIAGAAALWVAFAAAQGCGGSGSDEIVLEGFETERTRQLSQILTQLGEVVIPGMYAALQAELGVLEEDAKRFCAAPDTTGLESLRASWRQVMAAWARARVITFGPIEEENRRLRIQFWPDGNANVPRAVAQLLEVETPITAELLARRPAPAQGLSAMEYLLFDPAENPLAAFQAAGTGPRRCALATAIAANLESVVHETITAWDRAGGGWVDQLVLAGRGSTTFVKRGDAIDEIVGGILAVMVETRDRRLQDPLGVGSDSGPKPERSEAALGGISLDLIIDTLDGIERVYRGGEPRAADFGLDNLLRETGQEGLDLEIRERFDGVIDTASAIPVSLVDALRTPEGRTQVEAVVAAVKGLNRLLERDLVSATGVTVGFNANDGD